MADVKAASTTNQPQRRQLRERTRKHYTDDWAYGDDDIEGRRNFQVEEKIESDKYNLKNFNGLYREMSGSEFNVAYIQKHGFGIPVLIKEKTGLGIRIPSSNFTVNDVRTCVGSRRLVDVMDVNTQKNEEMTMKEWQKYFEDENKTRLLNVISLEFSHTKLENYVQSPAVVRQIDWVDVVWPKYLKAQQVESTNLLEDMMYPKVRKYVLMSVKGCYTDFHVDFGGTSVWYHILKGSKIFWLIPPTEKNLTLYQEWVLSGKQSDVFFGDMVDRCGRIKLSAGMTMFIPTGWIHAVFTPDDSLVFGGNFLHSYGIDKQLRVAEVEEQTKVPHKFRYPFFTEMLWYVLERYVHVLLGKSHLKIPVDEDQGEKFESNENVHLTPLELHGLKSIVMYLHSLPATKKSVPEIMQDPVKLIQDVSALVERHRHDSPELAVTGVPVLPPPPASTLGEREKSGIGRPRKMPRPSLPHNKASGPRRRRTRCKKCEACTRTDCGECGYCHDMVKFGGSGRAKQTCVMRQCMRPMLPVTAFCKSCGLDGWGQTPSPLMGKQAPTAESTLMECSICYEIIHPNCTGKDVQNTVVSDDLPNSWECPECCESGRNIDYGKSKGARGRPKKGSTPNTSMSENSIKDEDEDSAPSKKIKSELEDNNTNHSQSSYNGQLVELQVQPKTPYQNQTNHSEQMINNSNVSSKYNNNQQPQCRNAGAHPMQTTPYSRDKSPELPTWTKHPNELGVWSKMDMSNNLLTAAHLSSIVQHQPETLRLDWTNIAKKQLTWVLARISPLKHLSLKGCNWKGVCALNSYNYPALTGLDLDFVADFNDSSLREILIPTSDCRPGLTEKIPRLKCLRSLSLRGCDISDVSMRYIAQHLTHLETLDLSTCARITDAGIAQITSPPAATIKTLVTLNLAGCRLLTDLSLDYLLKCTSLKNLDLRNTTQFSAQKVSEYTRSANLNSFKMDPRPDRENRRETT